MRQLKTIISGLTLSVILIASSSASTYAAPGASATPPVNNQQASGPQTEPPIKAGSKDAKPTDKLGPTAEVKTDTSGKSKMSTNDVTTQSGNVSGVDFQTFYNYCYRNLVYATVKNTTSSVKYIHVKLYNQSTTSDFYTSVAAGGSYTYPAFYGINGTYSAYLYVWNGTSYVYDEDKSGSNVCNVSVSRVYNSGGWVELKIQNLGTAYANQVSTELSPYNGSGTYTGTQYDYPTPGGAAVYRWFQVGTQPYGILSYTSGSFNTPYVFTGDL